VKSRKGFSLWFDHDILNDAFPLVAKTKSSFLPYVSQVSFTEKWPEKLPFGIEWKHGRAELVARLGGPPLERKLFEEDDDSPILTWWERDMVPGETFLKLELKKKGLTVTLVMRETTALSSRHGVPKRPVVGLFVAWALSRGFIDEARFPQHRALIDRVKAREAQGSALVSAAMTRGLWSDHLVPNEAVRSVASGLFYGVMGLSLDGDLIALFGERTNEHGHSEPVLDDDAWDAVDRATPLLDQRFATWPLRRT
jgi:hypothetical protein